MPERSEVIDPLLLGVTRLGGRLFRNNSGIAFHKDGAVVKYGVGMPGGSDTLGWVPFHVKPSHVGRTLALFTAIEAKTGRLKPSQAQEAFLQAVNASGGLGLWGNDPDELLAAIHTYLEHT